MDRIIFSRMLVVSCGLSVLSIGLFALLGMLINMEGLYHWGHTNVPMANNTALACVLTGIALTAIGVSNKIWKVK